MRSVENVETESPPLTFIGDNIMENNRDTLDFKNMLFDKFFFLKITPDKPLSHEDTKTLIKESWKEAKLLMKLLETE